MCIRDRARRRARSRGHRLRRERVADQQVSLGQAGREPPPRAAGGEVGRGYEDGYLVPFTGYADCTGFDEVSSHASPLLHWPCALPCAPNGPVAKWLGNGLQIRRAGMLQPCLLYTSD